MPATTTQLWIVSIIVLSPFILVFAVYLWNWFWYDFLLLGGLNTGNDYKNDKVYYGNTTRKPAAAPIVYRKPKTTSLLAHERKCPPKAEFFGRLYGDYVESHGDEEEIYLYSV